MADNKNSRVNILRRTAREVKDYKVIMKVLMTLLIMLVIIAILLYVVAALYKRTGSFTVSINKVEMMKYGLSLSEYRDMSFKSSHLNADIDKEMTNIAEYHIADNVDDIDGEHNGEHYIAYTFYLQNTGDVPVSYDYSIKISNITHDLDEALRVRLYVNGSPTTYAKVASDGSGNPEPGTVPFRSQYEVMRDRMDRLDVDEITKFTVVIWIHGPDPDCIDWLIGGKLRLEMNMSVVY